MSNDQIIEILEITAKLMDLHNGDAFKIKSFNSAAYSLGKVGDQQLCKMNLAELTTIPSVGKGVAAKILEIVETTTLKELVELMSQTPEGVLEMFNIKGIGAKKIGTIWRELGIDNLHELQLACQNGQIAALKGFGESTQQKIIESLAFLQAQVGKLRMDKAELLGNVILEKLQTIFQKVAIAGQLIQKNETIDCIQFLVATEAPVKNQQQIEAIEQLVQDKKNSSPFVWRGQIQDYQIAIEIIFVNPERFVNEAFILNSHPNHLAKIANNGQTLLQMAMGETVASDEAIYATAGLPYIVAECRNGGGEFEYNYEELVTWADLKGILHNHSTYSDGKHSLEQMATFCKELGFEYFGIADHSQAANYANGLTPERVQQQHIEIEKLNTQLAPFKILKGIEADILGDGSLDYSDEVLASFDYVVASVHSNLSMSLEKATARLLRAIQNPHTTILGHPTGRLLLSREGYPIDHRTIIDACAEHGVVIEINASPWRLDLDWRWIDYCVQKGVMLSINPDAHERDGFYDMHYGVAVARKGGLTKTMTFNALNLESMQYFLKKRKH